MSDLKPCPCCPDGGNPEVIKSICGGVLAMCDCGLSGPSCDNEEEALDHWNTRHERVCRWTVVQVVPIGQSVLSVAVCRTGCGMDRRRHSQGFPRYCETCGGKIVEVEG